MPSLPSSRRGAAARATFRRSCPAFLLFLPFRSSDSAAKGRSTRTLYYDDVIGFPAYVKTGRHWQFRCRFCELLLTRGKKEPKIAWES